MRKRRFRAVFQVLALFAVLVPFASGQSKAAWVTIAPMGFEGTFPPAGGKWITYDASYNSSQGIWAKRSGGYNSAYAASPRSASPYNYNTQTWMRYGPFSLVGATDARMLFLYWMETEVGYDLFSWAFACTVERAPGATEDSPAAWTGQATSGNGPGPTSAWASATFSLKPCVGKAKVWVQFTFSSDQSVNYAGAFVDNIRIQKFVP